TNNDSTLRIKRPEQNGKRPLLVLKRTCAPRSKSTKRKFNRGRRVRNAALPTLGMAPRAATAGITWNEGRAPPAASIARREMVTQASKPGVRLRTLKERRPHMAVSRHGLTLIELFVF